MKAFILVLALSFVALLSGCSEIFETDISSKIVVLIAPGPGSETENLSPTFRWGAVEGASHYQLVIASPTLENPNNFYLDTLVTDVRFATTLDTGTYQWRLQAQNGAYRTAPQNRTFRIRFTRDLSTQTVRLRQPTKGLYTNQTSLRFEWDALPIADSYEFSLQTATGTQTETVMSNAVVKQIPANGAGQASQIYSWRVRALNNYPSQKDSEWFDFTLDTNPPDVPVLSTTDNFDFTSPDPVRLSWTSPANGGVDHYLLSVYTDQGGLLASYPTRVPGNATFFDVPNLPPSLISPKTRYRWKLEAVDRAGNRSAATSLRSFTF